MKALFALALAAAALTFPDVAARDLDGRDVVPSQLRGHPVVFALGFGVQSRTQVEPWTRWLVAGTHGKLTVVVMPVYPALPATVRSWIDHVIAGQTEPALRRFAWTTVEGDRLRQALGLPADEVTAVVLVDATGQVRFLGHGQPTPTAQRRFLAAWQTLPH